LCQNDTGTLVVRVEIGHLASDGHETLGTIDGGDRRLGHVTEVSTAARSSGTADSRFGGLAAEPHDGVRMSLENAGLPSCMVVEFPGLIGQKME
jgi:hypothetical protein